MKGIIKTDELCKTFYSEKGREIKALDNINIEIEDREFVCILGPSGSGKSTLLRLMAGLDRASSGSIKIYGKEIRKPIEEVGMVFQEYSLFPWRTVKDNIAFGLELKRVKKKERYEKSINILKEFGLEDFQDSYPYELSGGMRQRVAIAKAMVDSPSILFMDEPFGALDAQTRFQMQLELIDFWIDKKRTIVFVTHSIEEAIFLGSRVIVMSDRPGKVLDDFEIDLDYPRNRWDKNFEDYFEKLMQLVNVDYKKI